jgi:hypothetical protein
VTLDADGGLLPRRCGNLTCSDVSVILCSPRLAAAGRFLYFSWDNRLRSNRWAGGSKATPKPPTRCAQIKKVRHASPAKASAESPSV